MSIYFLLSSNKYKPMKFSAILVLALFATAVSAAPRRHRSNSNRKYNSNREHNSNVEDNSKHITNNNNESKQINQSIGSVGSSSNKGLLGGLLGGGVLSKNSNTNNVAQNANIN